MFSDVILMMILILILVVCVLVGVAFLTLLERKLLGYIQIRKGPNKVGFTGLLQPFSDAIKLFSKEQTFPFMSNFSIYYISPIMNLIIALLLWLVLPILSMNLSFMLGVLYFLAISSLGVYSVMLAGWSSNSNYSLLGSMRAVAQTISYEVSMFLIMMGFILLILSFNLLDFFIFQKNIWFLFLCLPFCFMWIITCLAETNRSPFDFAEGESELVSGFNVEYSSGGFAMIFLAEYASILFMSMISTLMFLGGDLLMFSLKLVMISFFWIWVRGTLPRFRYDKLMYLVWKSFLSCVLIYLIFFFNLKFIISVLIF